MVDIQSSTAEIRRGKKRKKKIEITLQKYNVPHLFIRAAITRRPASADRTERCQFQAVFLVIIGSFPTNVTAHLHGLSTDLTVGLTVGPTVDSTVG